MGKGQDRGSEERNEAGTKWPKPAPAISSFLKGPLNMQACPGVYSLIFSAAPKMANFQDLSSNLGGRHSGLWCDSGEWWHLKTDRQCTPTCTPGLQGFSVQFIITPDLPLRPCARLAVAGGTHWQMDTDSAGGNKIYHISLTLTCKK